MDGGADSTNIDRVASTARGARERPHRMCGPGDPMEMKLRQGWRCLRSRIDQAASIARGDFLRLAMDGQPGRSDVHAAAPWMAALALPSRAANLRARYWTPAFAGVTACWWSDGLLVLRRFTGNVPIASACETSSAGNPFRKNLSRKQKRRPKAPS